MKTLVFTYGRFQCTHKGHELLFNRMHELCTTIQAPMRIYATRTHNKDNPLPFNFKIKMLENMHSSFKDCFQKEHHKTLIEVLKSVNREFSSIVMMVGSDRVQPFKALLHAYNGIEYNFKNITVLQVGDDRDTNLGVASYSSSIVRSAIRNNDFETFKTMQPQSTNMDITVLWEMLRMLTK